MLVKVTEHETGPGPSEKIVAIKTADGDSVYVAVSARSVDGDGIEIGNVLVQEPKRSLIELPRESIDGKWRIWVYNSDLIAPALVE